MSYLIDVVKAIILQVLFSLGTAWIAFTQSQETKWKEFCIPKNTSLWLAQILVSLCLVFGIGAYIWYCSYYFFKNSFFRYHGLRTYLEIKYICFHYVIIQFLCMRWSTSVFFSDVLKISRKATIMTSFSE